MVLDTLKHLPSSRSHVGGSTRTLSISRVAPTRAATASTVGPVTVSTFFSVTGSTAAT